MECNNISEIDADRASGLRSFRLSSTSLPTYNIPANAPLDDLYICFRGAKLRNPVSDWIRALPDLTNLTALTICSTALRVRPQCYHIFHFLPHSIYSIRFV